MVKSFLIERDVAEEHADGLPPDRASAGRPRTFAGTWADDRTGAGPPTGGGGPHDPQLRRDPPGPRHPGRGGSRALRGLSAAPRLQAAAADLHRGGGAGADPELARGARVWAGGGHARRRGGAREDRARPPCGNARPASTAALSVATVAGGGVGRAATPAKTTVRATA